MSKCPIMKRMKELYELRQRQYLHRRTPVILRLDGKSFHSYCKPLNKFDTNFIEVMNLTAIKLVSSIQGAQIALIQSDEISILLHDYKTLTSEAWFDYNQSKIESISSAIASVEFTMNSSLIWNVDVSIDGYIERSNIKPAYFDSRAFNLPEAEVNNYFVARQRDAVKNSINCLGQTLYSQSELHKKNVCEVQDMCFVKGHNWNNLSTSLKRGRCVVKESYVVNNTVRNKWVVDNEIPDFSKYPDYINDYLTYKM